MATTFKLQVPYGTWGFTPANGTVEVSHYDCREAFDGEPRFWEVMDTDSARAKYKELVASGAKAEG